MGLFTRFKGREPSSSSSASSVPSPSFSHSSVSHWTATDEPAFSPSLDTDAGVCVASCERQPGKVATKRGLSLRPSTPRKAKSATYSTRTDNDRSAVAVDDQVGNVSEKPHVKPTLSATEVENGLRSRRLVPIRLASLPSSELQQAYAREHEPSSSSSSRWHPSSIAYGSDDKDLLEVMQDSILSSTHGTHKEESTSRQVSRTSSIVSSSSFVGLGVSIPFIRDDGHLNESNELVYPTSDAEGSRQTFSLRQKIRWRSGSFKPGRRSQTADSTRSRFPSFKGTDGTGKDKPISSVAQTLCQSTESLIHALPLRRDVRKANVSASDTVSEYDFAAKSPAKLSASLGHDTKAQKRPSVTSLSSSVHRANAQDINEDATAKELLGKQPGRVRQLSSSASQTFTSGFKQAGKRSGSMAHFLHDIVGTGTVGSTEQAGQPSPSEFKSRFDGEDQRDAPKRSTVPHDVKGSSIDSSLRRMSAGESISASLAHSPRVGSTLHTSRHAPSPSLSLDAALTRLAPAPEGLPAHDLMGRVEVIRSTVRSQATQAVRLRGEKERRRAKGRPHTSQGQTIVTTSDLEDAMFALERATESHMKDQFLNKAATPIEYHAVQLAAAFVEARRELDLGVLPARLQNMFGLTDVQAERTNVGDSMRRSSVSNTETAAVRTSIPVSLSPAPRRRRSPSASGEGKPALGRYSSSTTAEAAIEYDNILRQRRLPSGSPLVHVRASSSSKSHQDKETDDESVLDQSDFDRASHRDSNATSAHPHTPKSSSADSHTSFSIYSSPVFEDDKFVTVASASHADAAQSLSHADAHFPPPPPPFFQVLTPQAFKSHVPLRDRRPSSRGFVE